jgi:hypothetical protein
MGIYEFIGAFLLWVYSGFKGSLLDNLKPEMNFRLAYFGLFALLTFVAFVILILTLLSSSEATAR